MTRAHLHSLLNYQAIAMEAHGAIDRSGKNSVGDEGESSTASVTTDPKSDNDDGTDEETDDDDEDDEDEEPRLKYLSLTKNLNSLYRGGDATSCCLVGGDKMVYCSQTRISMLSYTTHIC